MAALSCEPQDLIDNATCLDLCIPAGAMDAVLIYFLCLWANQPLN